MKKINVKAILQHLAYDPMTCLFSWVLPTSFRVAAGDSAGCLNERNGYVVIRLHGELYLAHRLAYAVSHGDTELQIDHINRNRSDNRICNLRAVSVVDNSMNRSKSKRTTSGKIGVAYYKDYDNYVAYINVNKNRVTLGYGTLQEAIALRKNAEIKYYGKEMDN